MEEAPRRAVATAGGANVHPTSRFPGFRGRWRISHKLPALIVVIVMTAGGAVGLLAHRSASDTLRQAAAEELIAVTRNRAATLRAHLENLETLLSTLAAPPLVRDALEKPRSTEELAAFLLGRDPRREIVLADVAGKVRFSTLVASGPDDLTRAPWRETGLGRAFVATRNGNRDMVFEDFSVSDLWNGVPAAFLAAPVLDRNGIAVGVLALRVGVDPINEVMTDGIGLGPTGETVLIGSDGVARSDSRLLAKPIALRHRVSRTLLERLRGAEGGAWSGIDPLHDQPALMAHVPFEFLGTRWSVYAEVHEEQLLAPVREMGRVLLALGGVVVLLAAGLGAWAARGITRPLDQLGRGMERWRDGDWDVDLPAEDRKDEIGSLAFALGTMMRALKASHVFLEEQVRERTARLHASEARFRRLIEGLRDTYFFYSRDPDGTFRYLSPSVERVLGYSATEFPHRFVDFLSDDPINARAATHTRLSIDGVQQPPYELEVLHGDGSPRRLQVLETPAFDEAGKVIAVEGIAQDVTPQRRYEAELRAAKSEAEKADRLKSEFLNYVSHEMRTPLHAILSYARLGIDHLDDADRDQRLKYFQRISGAGDRLLRMIDDLLDLSRLEAGLSPFVKEPTDLARLVEGVVSDLRPFAAEHRVALEFAPPAFATEARIDAAKIGQVATNLLSNAVKFSPADGTVRVAFDAIDLPGGLRSPGDGPARSVRVSVIDQGIGIPETERELVFDKFVQGSHTRGGRVGSGLGLAICREIVARHGGRVWAEANPDGGTIFRFMLPLDTIA
jgi:PAS domain S-box-containing protein